MGDDSGMTSEPRRWRCGFLSIESLDDFVCDDDLAVPAFEELGWNVERVPWRAPLERFRDLDAVIVRSTWDYQKDPRAFVEALEGIERSGIPLANPIELMRWNVEKTYLRDLEARGARIVPTAFLPELPRESAELFELLRSDRIVVKPAIGANADLVFRVERGDEDAWGRAFRSGLGSRPTLAQPFRSSVLEEGELSLIFFDGELSHAVLKQPRPGDFRTQQEHGGTVIAIDPPSSLERQARAVLAVLTSTPLYARLDFVRSSEESRETFELMELELIEPSLFFCTAPAASRRFAAAFDRWAGRIVDRAR